MTNEIDELARTMFGFTDCDENGRVGWYDMSKVGAVHRYVKVEVIGVQRIWNGELAYRVRVIEDSLGGVGVTRPIQFGEIEWIN